MQRNVFWEDYISTMVTTNLFQEIYIVSSTDGKHFNRYPGDFENWYWTDYKQNYRKLLMRDK